VLGAAARAAGAGAGEGAGAAAGGAIGRGLERIAALGGPLTAPPFVADAGCSSCTEVSAGGAALAMLVAAVASARDAVPALSRMRELAGAVRAIDLSADCVAKLGAESAATAGAGEAAGTGAEPGNGEGEEEGEGEGEDKVVGAAAGAGVADEGAGAGAGGAGAGDAGMGVAERASASVRLSSCAEFLAMLSLLIVSCWRGACVAARSAGALAASRAGEAVGAVAGAGAAAAGGGTAATGAGVALTSALAALFCAIVLLVCADCTASFSSGVPCSNCQKSKALKPTTSTEATARMFQKLSLAACSGAFWRLFGLLVGIFIEVVAIVFVVS
jgi:hypothetical protein